MTRKTKGRMLRIATAAIMLVLLTAGASAQERTTTSPSVDTGITPNLDVSSKQTEPVLNQGNLSSSQPAPISSSQQKQAESSTTASAVTPSSTASSQMAPSSANMPQAGTVVQTAGSSLPAEQARIPDRENSVQHP